jgi:hypothetical protein
MSFTWPNKDPDELLDYTVDWSRFLSPGRTIAVVSWFIEDADGVKQPFIINNTIDGLTNTAISNSQTVAVINLDNGTLNKKYKIYCQITDTSGFVAERVVFLMIKEK